MSNHVLTFVTKLNNGSYLFERVQRVGPGEGLSAFPSLKVERAVAIYNPTSCYVFKCKGRETGFFSEEELETYLKQFSPFSVNAEDLSDELIDKINPDHYQGGGIETIDYIEAKGFGRGFNAGNVLKYVSRYRAKNGVEDLQKAQWYLNRLIALEESGLEDTDINSDIVASTPHPVDPIFMFEFRLTKPRAKSRGYNLIRTVSVNEEEAMSFLAHHYGLHLGDLESITKTEAGNVGR